MANDRTNMVSLLDFGKLMGGTASDILEMGDGYTEITEDWSPNMEEKQYVNMKTKANTLNGYGFSMSPERDHMSDEAQEYIDEMFRKFPTGKNAETMYYRFYKTDKIADGKYKGISLPVVVAPSSTGGSGGETLTSTIQLTGNGDVVEGVITVTAADGVITYSFEEGSASEMETVSVQSVKAKAGSGSLSD